MKAIPDIFLPVFLLVASTVLGATKAEIVEYKQGDTVLEGLFVHDPAVTGKRPAVLVVHQWKGLGPYEKKRAEMLAQLGYKVLCADIYGKGIRADNPQDAAAL